uniref:KARI N-terminal Rossmann domain-containing protein n=1 Tax=Panagrellus redivivus TaxID=6233 RepID=A0A7E4W391_PANRE
MSTKDGPLKSSTTANQTSPEKTAFDLSETQTAVIIGFGQLDTHKRYVSDKNVDTQIQVDTIGVLTDECIKQDQSTQYEPQKLSFEATRRAVHTLAHSEYLVNAVALFETELTYLRAFDQNQS